MKKKKSDLPVSFTNGGGEEKRVLKSSDFADASSSIKSAKMAVFRPSLTAGGGQHPDFTVTNSYPMTRSSALDKSLARKKSALELSRKSSNPVTVTNSLVYFGKPFSVGRRSEETGIRDMASQKTSLPCIPRPQRDLEEADRQPRSQSVYTAHPALRGRLRYEGKSTTPGLQYIPAFQSLPAFSQGWDDFEQNSFVTNEDSSSQSPAEGKKYNGNRSVHRKLGRSGGWEALQRKVHFRDYTSSSSGTSSLTGSSQDVSQDTADPHLHAEGGDYRALDAEFSDASTVKYSYAYSDMISPADLISQETENIYEEIRTPPTRHAAAWSSSTETSSSNSSSPGSHQHRASLYNRKSEKRKLERTNVRKSKSLDLRRRSEYSPESLWTRTDQLRIPRSKMENAQDSWETEESANRSENPLVLLAGDPTEDKDTGVFSSSSSLSSLASSETSSHSSEPELMSDSLSKLALFRSLSKGRRRYLETYSKTDWDFEYPGSDILIYINSRNRGSLVNNNNNSADDQSRQRKKVASSKSLPIMKIEERMEMSKPVRSVYRKPSNITELPSKPETGTPHDQSKPSNYLTCLASLKLCFSRLFKGSETNHPVQQQSRF